MPKRSSKKKPGPKDLNQLAKSIVHQATGQAPSPEDDPQENQTEIMEDGKNAAAVALGRLGGKKGGKARAEKLSPERRSKIARDAAKKRWSKEQDQSTES